MHDLPRSCPYGYALYFVQKYQACTRTCSAASTTKAMKSNWFLHVNTHWPLKMIARVQEQVISQRADHVKAIAVASHFACSSKLLSGLMSYCWKRCLRLPWWLCFLYQYYLASAQVLYCGDGFPGKTVSSRLGVAVSKPLSRFQAHESLLALSAFLKRALPTQCK